MATNVIKTNIVVLGSGPGGYSCAFRLADLLGEGVTLVERYDTLGGVCLNVGCIPSKALLHIAEVIQETKKMSAHGVTFNEPQIDIDNLRGYKEKVIKRLTDGLGQMSKMRKVNTVQGVGTFTGPNTLAVVKDGVETIIEFQTAVIAAGSEPINLPFMPKDDRIWDSTAALELREIPDRMLIVGGGIIGMEMACVYAALGTKVSVVELTDHILPGVDPDLSKPLLNFQSPYLESVMTGTKVTNVEAQTDGIWVTFEGTQAPAEQQRYDVVLSAVGRVPNGKVIGADKAGVTVNEQGFIPVDKQCRTNVPHIYAIGDIVGQPMLAHKAVPEGRLAAEVISGQRHYFDPTVIPNVAYTNPEVAWVGLTETDAKAKGIAYEKGVFPWAALGRALGIDRDEGLTKVLFDKTTHRILGAGIVGPHAGDLIAEATLAIEMGCEAEDIALTIHPHPTFSESLALATEVYEGTVTDLPNKKKK